MDPGDWEEMAGKTYQVCRDGADQYQGCVLVRVNDTGYLEEYGVLIDLSRAAFRRIGALGEGRISVTIREVR